MNLDPESRIFTIQSKSVQMFVIDPTNKFHDVSVKYFVMHHFVTEMWGLNFDGLIKITKPVWLMHRLIQWLLLIVAKFV